MEQASFGQLGKDIISLVELASLGKWAEAEALQKKAMSQVGLLMGDPKKSIPNVKGRLDKCSSCCGNLLASNLTTKGRWKKAEIVLQELWHLAQLMLPEGNPDLLNSIKNAADVLERSGNLQEAEEMHRMAVQICDRCFEEDHTYTLISMNNLANVLQERGKWQEAEEMYREVLEVRRRFLGEHHPDTLSSRHNLANVLREQGKWQQAEEMYREVLEVRRRFLGEHHPDTLSSRHNLANVLREQGKWREAEEMYREVLEVRCRVLGEHHPDTLSSVNNLAVVLQEQGKWHEAEAMHREVLEVRCRVLGKHHPDTLSSVKNLAVVLQEKGKWQEAEEMQREVLEVTRRVLGEDHPSTLSSMNNLALALQQRDRDDWKFRFSLDESSHRGRLEDAITMLRTAIGVQKHRVDDDHPELLLQKYSLAESLLQLNDGCSLQEAEELLLQIVPALQKRYGPQHKRTQKAIGDLVVLLEEHGKDAEEWRQQLNQIENAPDSSALPFGSENLSGEALGDWEGREEITELLRDLLGMRFRVARKAIASSETISGKQLSLPHSVASEWQNQDWQFRQTLTPVSHAERLDKLHRAIKALKPNDESSLEAENLLLQLVRALQRRYGLQHPMTQRAIGDLVVLLEKHGKDAKEWRQQLIQIKDATDSSALPFGNENLSGEALEEALEDWEGEEVTELLRDLLLARQFVKAVASSDPSSSQAAPSQQPLDAAASQASSVAASLSSLSHSAALESVDDASSSDSSAWLRAALALKAARAER